MKRLFAAVLLTAVLSAQMSWAVGTEPPVDLNPAEEQTLLHVGREYRFYFTDAQGEIPDPPLGKAVPLSVGGRGVYAAGQRMGRQHLHT